MRFGAPESVTVEPSSLYAFPDALPGLPESHRFALIQDEAYAPLCWLQSLDEEPVCLPLLPLDAVAVEGYAAAAERTLGDHEGQSVLLVTRFDDEKGSFAVNLLAPVVLDTRAATGWQAILDGQAYPLRQYIAWDGETRTFRPLC